MDEERFKNVLAGSKFYRAPKRSQKVKIDSRFSGMFEGKHFKVKYKVDSRGRPLEHTSSEDLKRYYALSSDEEEEGDEESSSDGEEEEGAEGAPGEKSEGDGAVGDKVKQRLSNLKVDYARGEARLFSDSSSDDEETEEDEEEEATEEKIEHKWGELDKDAPRTDEITKRLAACNMDWDRIRAIDLMVLFNSFLPPNGCIESVRIYPSEFGKKRMKEEEIKGPMELVQDKTEAGDDEEEEEGEEGANYHMEKLRLYQLNRLKYYYAVVVCDSANSANKIYTECDGMEYESSATKIDLRFIPDGMVFDEEAKESCEKLPELTKYQPRFFTTTALQQAKVDLTWDETNPDRVEMTQKLSSGKVDDVTDADLEAYLALSSEGESEGEEKLGGFDGEGGKSDISKYKALLAEIEEQEERKKNKDVEMEVTWGLDAEKKAEEVVKKKLGEREEKTPFEQYLEKRKQKRKERKKLKQQQQGADEESDSDVPSDVDLNDAYFAEEFKNGDFKNGGKSKKKKNAKEVVEDSGNLEQENELELLLMDDDGKKHFNLKHLEEGEGKGKKKKNGRNKRKRGEEVGEKEDDFEVDVKDARFSALYTSHHFNVDPTDSRFKKTKGMRAIVEEKMKRRVEGGVEEEKVVVGGGGGAKKKSAELSVLVKSVKRKAGGFSGGKK